MPTFKAYCGAALLIATLDPMAALSRIYSCLRTSPASPVTLERDGEELTVAEIHDLEHTLTLGMSFEEIESYQLRA